MPVYPMFPPGSIVTKKGGWGTDYCGPGVVQGREAPLGKVWVLAQRTPGSSSFRPFVESLDDIADLEHFPTGT